MNKQTDIFNNIPEIGDIIVYNPPKYKGLIYGTCVGFAASGLPKLKVDEKIFSSYIGQSNTDNTYTPKTGFIIKYK